MSGRWKIQILHNFLQRASLCFNSMLGSECQFPWWTEGVCVCARGKVCLWQTFPWVIGAGEIIEYTKCRLLSSCLVNWILPPRKIQIDRICKLVSSPWEDSQVNCPANHSLFLSSSISRNDVLTCC